MSDTLKRLEYLRGQLRAECISYGELHELQGLAEHIEPGDVELLEAAGVPEHEPGTVESVFVVTITHEDDDSGRAMDAHDVEQAILAALVGAQVEGVSVDVESA